MDIDAYFKRIGFNDTPDNSLETLQKIHLLHPQAITFENLSSFLSDEINLQPADVFNKLVTQGRGGYCFEQNLLLATVLKQLGFEVSEHAARVVWFSADKTKLARTHMLLKVVVEDDTYIADVGFGGLTMTAPLLLEAETIQHTPHEECMISQSGDEYTIAVKVNDNWKSMYIFDLISQYLIDFEMANFYVSTHPASLFLNNLMIGRPFKNGRHALSNRLYTKYKLDGTKVEKRIDDVEVLLNLLENTFKIDLTSLVDVSTLREKFEKLD